MKTTILFPFRRISISFFASVALLGFHTLCAEVATVQTDAKTTSASPVERVAQASTRAHFGTQPLRRMGDWADDPNEAAQLQSIFDSTRNAYASIAPGPDEGAKRKAVSMELTRELESFLQQHPSSGWAADLHLQLALACQLRSSYSKAIEYYSLAWEATKDFEQNPARQIALEAAGPLARLLAVTGRNAQLETLRAEAQAAVKVPPSTEWNLGFDLAAWFSRHPGDAYRCGLYCLDQLARLSQAGPYDPMSVLRVDASLNGFTAGELVAIGRQANLPMRVVFLSDLSEFPVPCIVHLKVEHFVVVRERRGEF